MSDEEKLDAVSVDPLYRQLLVRLRSAIASGEYPVNSRMPSEKELCENYSISRVTVRRALKELTDEGLIVRHQGKGSFVTQPRLERNLGIPKSFTELCTASGRKPSAMVLKIHEIPAAHMDERFLNQQEGKPVLEIIRLCLADGEPVILEKNHFPMSYDWLKKEDMSQSLYQLLRSRGLEPGKSKHEISLCTADHQDAEQLNVQPGTVLLLLNEVICDRNGSPIFLSSQMVRGDKFTFRI